MSQQKSKKEPKFTRQEADERRNALVDATIHCLTHMGPRATSVRAICSQAGVSPGLLRHYYDGKEDLIASAYEHLTGKLNHSFSIVLESEQTAENKLKEAFEILLNGEWVSEEMLGAWVGFWSLQRNDERMQSHHKIANDQIRSLFSSLLKDFAFEKKLSVSEKDLRNAAIELSGLSDGLWLELCLDAQSFTGEDAVKICLNWLKGFEGRYLD